MPKDLTADTWTILSIDTTPKEERMKTYTFAAERTIAGVRVRLGRLHTKPKEWTLTCGAVFAKDLPLLAQHWQEAQAEGLAFVERELAKKRNAVAAVLHTCTSQAKLFVDPQT